MKSKAIDRFGFELPTDAPPNGGVAAQSKAATALRFVAAVQNLAAFPTLQEKRKLGVGCAAAFLLRRALQAAVAMALLGLAPAHAFVTYINSSGKVLRWNLASPNAAVHTNVVNRQTKAIRYFIGADAFSSANKTAELNAVRASFAQWQSVPGTILKFEEGGLIGPGADINTNDHTNVVFWAKNRTLVNGGMDDIRGLAGFTITRFSDDNTIFEADVVLNGVEYQWLTDLTDTVTAHPFIEATVLHEIGHFLGLDHSPMGGGAMLAQVDLGVSTQLGLSSDEVAAIRYLYSQSSSVNILGQLQGRITKSGAPVLGAMITAEDAHGNAVAGTISRANGGYELPAMPPGDYRIRVTPLDPTSAEDAISLLRGWEIAQDYDAAETSFLPTTNKAVSLQPGATNTLDVPVVPGEPPFRIAAISRPSDHPDADTRERTGVFLRPGQSNLWVGVVSPSLPGNGAILTVTGDGVTVGPTVFKPNRFVDGSHVMSVLISVSSGATAGLRSLVVQQGTNFAYANGYLEILPLVPDFNFDGLDDTFQRKFFPLFTASEAAPGADPDGDGYENLHEYRTGTDPTDPGSLAFRILSINSTKAGSTITWQSKSGRRYQVFTGTDFSSASWQAIGSPVVANGDAAQFLAPPPTNTVRFYRVQALP